MRTAVAIVTLLALAAPAAAQISLTPQPSNEPAAAPKAKAPPAPAKQPAAKQPAAKAPAKAEPKSDPKAAQQPASGADIAFGAYQRGFYLTAFAAATRRASEERPLNAMRLAGMALLAGGAALVRLY